MLIASDGNACVVKFANNPQSPRVLVNEWLACSIGRAIGLSIPKPVILSVPEEFVEHDPSAVIQLAGSTLKCSPGQVHKRTGGPVQQSESRYAAADSGWAILGSEGH